MLRVSESSDCDFIEEYKNNITFLNEHFPEWKKTKYMKLFYCFTNHSANFKLAIVKKMYVFHVFRFFIMTYKWITKTLKIDIKW